MSAATLRPARILVVAGQHPDIAPGEEQQAAYELFDALRATEGCQASFLAGVEHERHPELARPETPIRAYAGCNDEYLLGVHGFDPFRLSSSAPLPGFWAAATRFLAALEPDCILVHGLAELGFEFLRVARRASPASRIFPVFSDFTPICPAEGRMVQTRGQGLFDRAGPARCSRFFPDRTPAEMSLRARWLKAQLACTNLVIATSGFLRAQLLDWGLAADRVAVIRPALPDASVGRSPASATPTRNRFGLFGELSEEKGLGIALDAAASLIASDVTGFELVLQGDARAAPEPLQRRLREMATLPQIRTPMPGGDRVPDAALARVDWVLVPSLWWESAPRSVEAAFRAGRPVLCSDQGGLAERVSDGVNGLCFPLGDADALAEAMARCIAEPALWDRLAAGIPAGRGQAEQLAAYRALWSAPPVVMRQPEPVAQARSTRSRSKPG